MADLSNISLTSNIGYISGGTGGNQYHAMKHPQKKNQKINNLRVGEIVRGTITERIDDNLAYVSLPIGILTAVVGNHLKKDDTLLFKVMEVNPALNLKVFEVYVGKDSVLYNNDELLRLLDLVKNDVNNLIIDYYKKIRKSLNRDEILQIIRKYGDLKAQFPNKTQEKLVKALIEMQVSKLPLSNNLITKLVPLFISENNISQLLNQIELNLNKLDDNYNALLSHYFEDIKNNSYNKNNIFSIVLEQEGEKSFFELMIEISEMNLGEISENASEIRDLITSMGLWNIISFSGKNSFHYIIPYYFDGYYYIIRIIKRYINNTNEEQVSFNFSIPSDNLGEIKSKVLAFQKQLKVYLQAENNKIVTTLDNFKENLRKALMSKNFNLEMLHISINDIQEELNEINNSEKGSHFTIVV